MARRGRPMPESIPTDWSAYTSQVIEENFENLYKYVSLVQGADRGGTGLDGFAIGDVLYADTTTTLARLTAVATGNALISGGVATAPSWGKIGLTTHVSGVLPVANGGTNLSSYAVGDLIYADGATSLAKLADVATGNALISGGVGVAPSWGKIGLTTHVSGTLPATSGGTGQSTWTTGQMLYASATDTLAKLAAPAGTGQIMQGASGLPSWSLFYPATVALGTLIVGASTSVYSTLAHPGSAGKLLVSSATGVLVAWTSATFPTTVATGDLLYGSATNVWSALTAGTSGYVLTSNGPGVAPSWQAATGGVTGPGSSTDNAIARWNGTGGTAIQNSGVVVDDSNNVTGALSLTITQGTLTDPNTAVAATATWNDAADTFKGITLAVTVTAAAAASRLVDLSVGGSTVFDILTTGGFNSKGDVTIDATGAASPPTYSGMALRFGSYASDASSRFGVFGQNSATILIGGNGAGSGTAIGSIKFLQGDRSTSSENDARICQIDGVNTSSTETTTGGILTFRTRPSTGSLTLNMVLGENGGLQMYSSGAAPTGGDKGTGTINVGGDIYKNNTAYANPAFVFEYAYTGHIARFAREAAAAGLSDYSGRLSLADTEAFAREHMELPLMARNKDRGLFDRGDLLLASLEEAYLHLFELSRKIAALESALAH